MMANRRRLAVKIYREKIILERQLIKDLKIYFSYCKKQMASGHYNNFISIKSALMNHNARVVKTIIRPGRKKLDRSQLVIGVINDNTNRIIKSAAMIDSKTLELAQRSQENAREMLKDKDGTPISPQALNKTSANIFNNYNRNRIAGIALTESSGLYEASKRNTFNRLKPVVIDAIRDDDIDTLEDIDGMYDNDTFDEALDSVKKNEDTTDEIVNGINASTHEWVSMGDEKVRETHADADGQEKPIDEAFEVGESLLMYPGDESLGAGPEEIVNCRCSEIF